MTASNNLRDRPPSKQAVWNLVAHVWGEDWDGDRDKICSFRFADLRHSGELSLVAIIDGGSAVVSCDLLAILDRTPAGFEEYDYIWAGLRSDDVNDFLKDIDNDGNLKIVVQPYSVPTGEDLPPVIYAWTGSDYTNVSSRYPKYYRDWLASLKKEIATSQKEREVQLEATPTPSTRNGIMIVVPAPSGSGPAPAPTAYPMRPEQPEGTVTTEPEPDYDLDAKLALAAKIERFLGANDAGMTNAIGWANSPDPHERKLAAQVFADMATPDALIYEQTLSHDSDHDVAKFASRQIKYWDQKAAYWTAPFEQRTPNNQ